MADDLCADVDQLLTQAGQRPRLRRVRHRERSHPCVIYSRGAPPKLHAERRSTALLRGERDSKPIRNYRFRLRKGEESPR
jgi:hypothetical protein